MHRRRVVLQREAARRGLGGGAHAPQQCKAVQEVHSRHRIGLEWVWLAGGRAGRGCRAAVHQAGGRGRGGRAGRAEGEEVAARRCPPRRLQLCDGQQRVGAGVHEGGGHPAVACGGRRAGGWEGGCLLPAGVGGGGRRISNTRAPPRLRCNPVLAGPPWLTAYASCDAPARAARSLRVRSKCTLADLPPAARGWDSVVSLQGAWRGVAYQLRSCCCLHGQPRHTDRAPHVLPCAHPCACRRPEAAPPGSSGWQRPRREAIAASLAREAATRALELSGSAPRCRLTPGAVLSTMFGQGRRAEDQIPMKSALKSSSWLGPAIARQRPASALGRLNTAYFRWLTRILAPCLFLLLQGGLTRHAGPARPVATHQGPNASQGEEKGGAPLLGERTGGRSTAGEVAPDKQRASTQRPALPRAAPQKKAKKAPAYLTSDADLAPFGVKVVGGGACKRRPLQRGTPRRIVCSLQTHLSPVACTGQPAGAQLAGHDRRGAGRAGRRPLGALAGLGAGGARGRQAGGRGRGGSTHPARSG